MAGQPQAPAAGDEPGTPNSYLFDTGTVSPEPLPVAALAAKSGWTLIPEDTVTHKFRGDVVLSNDKLIVILRGKGGGAEVYAQTPAGPKQRAVVAALPAAGGDAAVFFSARIVENNPGAVMVEAAFQAAGGGSAALGYRLTAGQPVLEVRCGEGAGKVQLRSAARYVVVPDFFGDDMVFGPETFPRSRLRLPAENYFLGLLDEGRAMVMGVWQSGQQGAEVVVCDQGPRRAITACEIECLKNKSLWLAFLEGKDLWHERTLAAEEMRAGVTLDWKPPFSAKWRVDLVGSGGWAQSWYFHSREETGQSAPGLARQNHPCCLEADRAVVRLGSGPAAPPAGRYRGPLLVYAMDRSRATPLTAFCPIDVLRNTLGVGPCQYVLQTEGLASDTNPTPDNVMTWVERQFGRKKEKKAAEEIGDLLKQMTDHVAHVQARIERYAGLGRNMVALCQAESQKPDASAAATTLGRSAARLAQSAAAGSQGPPPGQRAAQLAARVVALIGQQDALAACQRLGAEIRGIGAVQDQTLSNCRMAVRWLKAQAGMISVDDPAAGELARKVRAEAQQVLQGK